MERKACCENECSWSSEEEEILRNHVQVHGEENWQNLPQTAGLNRCGESCKQRWLNYIKPAMYEENFSWDEEDLIIKLHKLLGNRWSIIAGRLPGRTEVEIESFWKNHLSKKEEENHKNKEFPSTGSVTSPTQMHNFQSLVRCTENSFGIDHAESPNLVFKPKAVRLTKAFKPTHYGLQF